MPIDLVVPDLDISLRLDEFAPRAARYHVCHVDRPSPDLRNAVALLTSEIVSRAVQHGSANGDALELRVWMPQDVVRVELWAPDGVLEDPDNGGEPEYDLMLLDQIADRWSIDSHSSSVCMWFEIDRHGHPGEVGREWRD
jgi:hypothetical protein